MTDKLNLTAENHVERDRRLDYWSTDGLGGRSHSTDEWVKIILSIRHQIELPEMLQDMFDRARACMVYGCYHYPLFTLGSEELFRFGESAFREAIKEFGASKTVLEKPYAQLQKWAHDHGLTDDDAAKRWKASRFLRNTTSHKDSTLLLGPNDALDQLYITVELTEALFEACRSRGQPSA
jgi:hypothetical protein